MTDEQRSWEIETCGCVGLLWDDADVGRHCVDCNRLVRRITVYEQPEALRGRIEQDLENEQVRRLQRTGRCPTCGAENR